MHHFECGRRSTMHALSLLCVAVTGLCVAQSSNIAMMDGSCDSVEGQAKGESLMQKKHVTSHTHIRSIHELAEAHKVHSRRTVERSFLGGGATESGSQPCAENTYTPSPMETQWTNNVLEWTGATHCSHMTPKVAQSWIQENKDGSFDPAVFSKICRKGQLPQFIEPLAGILRDPRFGCDDMSIEMLFSVDWLVLPDAQAHSSDSKSRFYDAGGSTFKEALQFFLQTYSGKGILFDEVYVWEFKKQGAEAYWEGTDAKTRAFWEPRVSFYDGIPVSAEQGSEHNPVERIFSNCAPDDFCVFKLDIDTPQVELPLIEQLLGAPNKTQSALDEIFFEHHVQGVMQQWWGAAVRGTFADSYKIFGDLRKLGVRAHSWV